MWVSYLIIADQKPFQTSLNIVQMRFPLSNQSAVDIVLFALHQRRYNFA